MISGANQQNKSLRNAAAQPKDTSHRLQKATSYSAKVSSTSRRERADSNASTVKMDKKAAKRIQGSYEGLMHSSSTVLQPNGVGYDKKSLQTARYNKKFAYHQSSSMNNPSSLLNNKTYSIIDNYSSVTMKDSSSDRLNSIVQTNMMFK